MAEFFCHICDKGLGRVYHDDAGGWASAAGTLLVVARMWSHGWFRHPRELYRHWRDA